MHDNHRGKDLVRLPTIEDACTARHAFGVLKYRKGSNTAFQGDPVEELFEELIDGINYAEEAHRKGVPLALEWRDQLRNVCLEVRRALRAKYFDVQRSEPNSRSEIVPGRETNGSAAGPSG